MSLLRARRALSVAVRAAVAVLAVLTVTGLSGCGDGGSSSGNSIRPYIGRWAGTVVVTPAGSPQTQNGTVDILVASDGDVTGTLTNTTTNETGAISGVMRVDDDETDINGTITYSATSAYQIVGTLKIQPNEHLTGNVYSYNSQRILQSTAAVDLARQ